MSKYLCRLRNGETLMATADTLEEGLRLARRMWGETRVLSCVAVVDKPRKSQGSPAGRRKGASRKRKG